MTPSSINIDPDTGQIVKGKVLFQGPASSGNKSQDSSHRTFRGARVVAKREEKMAG